MTHLPTHTPYDGSSKLFQIGLKPLDLDDWIEIDHTFDAQLREKRRVYAAHADKVFVAEAGTEDAQREVLDLLREHLPRRFPGVSSAHGDGLKITGHPAPGAAEMRALPPLHIASLLVQEDLILMRRSENGWRLAAGSLCFPSSWKLTEKFGKPMHEIHEPVPAFGPGTRMADLIARMFDKLQTGNPVQRFNWSIQANARALSPAVRRRAHRPRNQPAVEISGRRCGCACLHPRRAPDAAQAACIGRYPVHHPHPSRPDCRC